ncbi:DUF3000 domain-containing protein [Acaricomes phytoseiuli]|uniref:DUF3000 domain-containing protein n=1 Tax=Acaricomes phytoseiuli TaxID=291968 RepID=UPI0003A21D6E|nr:DUF3000 domain-containing protein [Acaricomes phytoseiuli]MCW1250381.1 DUF3000 domain-containing protein [Acaricomes phytoseiuli]
MSAIAQVPSEFHAALGTLRQARCRRELRLEEIPAPSRLAPHAVALAAEVWAQHSGAAAEQDPLATGRFILLHDPDGSPIWDGTFRIVTYIRAQLEADLGHDALLGSVAWTWLVEALEQHGTRYRAAGGTATRILSESFGSLSGRPDAIDIELRASWTPEHHDVQEHLEAWSDMVCTFAGLPPLPEGVSALPQHRRN